MSTEMIEKSKLIFRPVKRVVRVPNANHKTGTGCTEVY